MSFQDRKEIKKIEIAAAVLVLLVMMVLVGCGNRGAQKESGGENPEALEETASTQPEQPQTGIAFETAKDAEIDFKVLKEENPDIFAWLHVPGTNIDCPVLQSEEADDYYETHNAYGKEDPKGAVYTELANLKDMCDFNTVLHGKGTEKEDVFAELYQFGDKDFFQKNHTIYLYLEDNLLTYEVFAAYEREDSSLIRTYDFTYAEGCEAFLQDLYYTKTMGKNIREGWGGISAYNFLITLTVSNEATPGKQYVVVAALVGDAAGKIDRIVE